VSDSCLICGHELRERHWHGVWVLPRPKDEPPPPLNFGEQIIANDGLPKGLRAEIDALERRYPR
jgi:hypothetical protein